MYHDKRMVYALDCMQPQVYLTLEQLLLIALVETELNNWKLPFQLLSNKLGAIKLYLVSSMINYQTRPH